MSEAHVLVIPYPVQGHVIPLMEFSNELVKHGIKVTFVNTDSIHNQIIEALREKGAARTTEIELISIPDGLEEADRYDVGKFTESTREVMPKKLEMLIQEINASDSNKITCVVADGSFGWALQVAKKMGIRTVAFCAPSASLFALTFNISKLLDDGIIDNDGTPTKDQTIHLTPNMPAMRTTEFYWTSTPNLIAQKIVFEAIKRNIISMKAADRVICNTTNDHEPAAFDLAPEIIPIGPLLAGDHLVGSFLPEDSTCMNWLDQQPVNSVIYVAFGSTTIFDHTQLQELALGLELTNRPFLWVVRPDVNNGINHAYLKEFGDRVSPLGKVVQWAPQQKVLSHPSVTCFMSHCGWNSTMEGTANGVPFLCWPYFADQFLNETYICEVWKVGLRVDRSGGIITRQEITSKINQLLHDEKFKVRAMKLKDLAINSIKEGGSSYRNLNNLVEWIKA